MNEDKAEGAARGAQHGLRRQPRCHRGPAQAAEGAGLPSPSARPAAGRTRCSSTARCAWPGRAQRDQSGPGTHRLRPVQSHPAPSRPHLLPLEAAAAATPQNPEPLRHCGHVIPAASRQRPRAAAPGSDTGQGHRTGTPGRDTDSGTPGSDIGQRHRAATPAPGRDTATGTGSPLSQTKHIRSPAERPSRGQTPFCRDRLAERDLPVCSCIGTGQVCTDLEMCWSVSKIG